MYIYIIWTDLQREPGGIDNLFSITTTSGAVGKAQLAIRAGESSGRHVQIGFARDWEVEWMYVHGLCGGSYRIWMHEFTPPVARYICVGYLSIVARETRNH